MPVDRSSRKTQPRSRPAGRKAAGAQPPARERQAAGAQPPAREVRARHEATLHLQDPRAIRALAHPARMAIIDALASGDELTATECAELTGLSPSATAYHLKLLERYHFAEPAPARNDGRERPWRASDRRTLVDLDSSTPAGAAATAAVAVALIDRTRGVAEEFIPTERDEPEDWQDVAALANTDLWLTAEEARAVTAAIAAVLEPYRGRALADRPDGTRRVRVMNIVVPHRRH
jgi:DNA-binding transcriptional ArsR family regulator